MAGSDLVFSVKAADQASQVFAKVAAAVEALEKKLDELDGRKVKVTVQVDVDDAQLHKLDRDLGRLNDRKVKVQVDVDDSGLKKLGDRTGRDKVQVDADADTAAAAAKLKEIDKQVDALDGRTAKVKVDVDGRTAAAGFAAARDAGDDFARSSPQVSRSARTAASGFAAARDAGDGYARSLTTIAGVDRDRISVARTADRVTGAVASGFIGLGRAAGAVGKAVGGAGRYVADFGGELGELAPKVGGVIGPLVKLGAYATAGTAVGVGLAAAWGAVSTGVAALPGALSLVAVPAAAVALGFDGIKKAAQTLAPEFKAMQAAVSTTFEKGLIPAFQKLKPLMPVVQQGMVGVAKAMSESAVKMADFLASSDGMTSIKGIFSGVTGAIRDMTPGIIAATDASLTLASQKPLYDGLAEAVNRTGEAFNGSVNKLVGSGAMTRAFQGLGDVVGSLGEGMVSLVENGIELFAGAAPGVSSFVKDLTGFFDQVNWESVGASVGQVFDGIGKAFKNVPPETARAFEGAMAQLGETFSDPQVQQGITDLLNTAPTFLEGLNRTVKQTITVVSEVVQAAEPVVKAVNALDQFIADADKWSQETADKLRGHLQAGAGDIPGLASTDMSGMELPPVTANLPVTVVPQVQMAQGAIASAAATVVQGFGNFAGIEVNPTITVAPQVQMAQGAIASAAATIAQGFGDFTSGQEVTLPLKITPQIQMATGAVAAAAASIVSGFGNFAGITVSPSVTVNPQVEIATNAIAAAAANLQSWFGNFTLGNVDASVTVNPVPQIGQLTLPAPEVPSFPAQDAPLPVTPNPEVAPIPTLPPPVMPGQIGPITVPASITYQPQPQPMPQLPAPTISPVSASQTVNVARQSQVQAMQTPPPPTIAAVSATQGVNVAQTANVTAPPTPPAPSIPAVHTTQTVYVRQVTVTTASTGAIAGATAGAGGSSSQLRAEVAARQRADLAGGGVVGFAGGGPVGFPGGGVLAGYQPGRDTVPAILSRGEAVLVPELVKQLGPGNIMAANYAASHRQPARLPMAAGGPTSRVTLPMTRTSNRSGSPDVVAALGTLRRDVVDLREALTEGRTPVTITVNDQSGDPVETARATQLALRMARV